MTILLEAFLPRCLAGGDGAGDEVNDGEREFLTYYITK